MWRLLAKSLSSGFDQEYCFSDHSSLFGECGLWSLRQRPCLAEWGVPGMFMRSTGLPWRSKGRVKCWLQRWTFLGMDKELAQLGPRTDSYKAWLELRKGQPNLGTSFSWRRARGGHTEDKKGALRVQVSDTLMVLLACQGNPVRQELQTLFTEQMDFKESSHVPKVTGHQVQNKLDLTLVPSQGHTVTLLGH